MESAVQAKFPAHTVQNASTQVSISLLRECHTISTIINDIQININSIGNMANLAVFYV